MNNEEELEKLRSRVEYEFNTLLDKGEDIRCYLYFPQSLLTENVKKHLDEYLLNEAYRELDHDNFELSTFTVYQDSLVTVKLEKVEQQIELLERMIAYYVKREEFEKCSKLKNLLTQIGSRWIEKKF